VISLNSGNPAIRPLFPAKIIMRTPVRNPLTPVIPENLYFHRVWFHNFHRLIPIVEIRFLLRDHSSHLASSSNSPSESGCSSPPKVDISHLVARELERISRDVVEVVIYPLHILQQSFSKLSYTFQLFCLHSV
jgi:hypothetical protein